MLSDFLSHAFTFSISGLLLLWLAAAALLLGWLARLYWFHQGRTYGFYQGVRFGRLSYFEDVLDWYKKATQTPPTEQAVEQFARALPRPDNLTPDDVEISHVDGLPWCVQWRLARLRYAYRKWQRWRSLRRCLEGQLTEAIGMQRFNRAHDVAARLRRVRALPNPFFTPYHLSGLRV
jgi:hypothetical protein